MHYRANLRHGINPFCVHLSENGNKMPCDGYFRDVKLVVEFDGPQHRIPVDAYGGLGRYLKTLLRDQIRNECIP